MVKPENLVVGETYQLPVGKGKLIGFEGSNRFDTNEYGYANVYRHRNNSPSPVNDYSRANTKLNRAIFELEPGHTWEFGGHRYAAWPEDINYITPKVG